MASAWEFTDGRNFIAAGTKFFERKLNKTPRMQYSIETNKFHTADIVKQELQKGSRYINYIPVDAGTYILIFEKESE